MSNAQKHFVVFIDLKNEQNKSFLLALTKIKKTPFLAKARLQTT